MGDSYCSLAWGGKLAGEAGADVAGGGAARSTTTASTMRSERSPDGRARSHATRTTSPPATSPSLRDAGFTDGQIFAITLFVSLRIAFSTVNDALGAHGPTGS